MTFQIGKTASFSLILPETGKLVLSSVSHISDKILRGGGDEDTG